MKHKILKIIFLISLIPIILCLISGVLGAVNGIEYATMSGDIPEKVFGIKAFWESFLSLLFALSIVGIIPACMLYQIIYIFIDQKGKED